MINNRNKILLTFDTELFFGKGLSSIEDDIFNPLNRIADILESTKSNAVFFIDMCHIHRLLKEKRYLDFESYKKIVKRLLGNGSSIEPHFHPHWIDAVQEGNSWNFSNLSRYRHENLDRDFLNTYFTECLDSLGLLCDQEMRFSIYRAGGWCIDPFERLRDLFITNEIMIDSSFAKGEYLDNGIHKYDFRVFPKKEFWYFKNSPHEEDISGDFLEVSTTNININIILIALNRLYVKYSGVLREGVEGVHSGSKNKVKAKPKLLYKNKRVSFDGNSFLFFKYIFRKSLDQNELVQVVSHPKNINSEWLKSLRFVCENFETLNSEKLKCYLKLK